MKFLNSILLFSSIIVALIVAEFICKFVPEISDNFIVRVWNVKEKYHHPLSLKESLEKPNKGSYRIIFLGDSFTYGICDAQFSFPRLIKDYLLSGNTPEGVAFNVQAFNMGVPSYSPSIYGAVLKDFVPIIKPHLVVLSVDDSDPQDDFFYQKLLLKDNQGMPISVYPDLPGVPDVLKPVAREIKIIRVFFAMWDKLFVAPQELDFLGQWVNRLEHYSPNNLSKWESAFSRTVSLIDVIVNYCHRENIKIVLVNYPYPPAVTTKYCSLWRKYLKFDSNSIYDPVFHSIQRKYALSKNIPYYDFTQYLREYNDLDGIYNEEDAHFTNKGNILLAQELVRFLVPMIDQKYVRKIGNT